MCLYELAFVVNICIVLYMRQTLGFMLLLNYVSNFCNQTALMYTTTHYKDNFIFNLIQKHSMKLWHHDRICCYRQPINNIKMQRVHALIVMKCFTKTIYYLNWHPMKCIYALFLHVIYI